MLNLQNVYEPTQNDDMQCSQLECCCKKMHAHNVRETITTR